MVTMNEVLAICGDVTKRVMVSEPTFFIQAISALLLTLAVYIFCQISNAIVSGLTNGKPYIPTVIEVGKHKLKGMLGIDVS